MIDARTAAGARAVVLVHGGFVDGSGWQGVYTSLVKRGYTVEAFKIRRTRWPTTWRSRYGPLPVRGVRWCWWAIHTAGW